MLYMRQIKAFLAVVAICFGTFLDINAIPSGKSNSEFTFFTIYNPATNKFISDLPEMLRILHEQGFRQVGFETGDWDNLCQMMGCECVRIYTYRKGEIIVKLYIDDIIDPHGELVSTDIIFKSEDKQEKFLKDAVRMGFRAGEPYEGSVYYTRNLYIFESGSRYVAELDEVFPAIQLGGGYDDPERDKQIFRLTPEVRAKLYKYDEVDLFSYGLARVCKAGKWGFIDLNGDEVIPCKYDTGIGRFSEGLAMVEEDYDIKYNALKVKFIDNVGRDIIYGHYYLPAGGNSLDEALKGPPVFYDGKCLVWADAKWVFPSDKYEDGELVAVMINKKGIISIDEDDIFFDEDYPTGGNEINIYPYEYFSPIEKAYTNEALTGSPYYIGCDTIHGGNGSSLVSLYLVDLTKPKLSQLVEEIHGIMDYRGVSTITSMNKINFERRANVYISRRKKLTKSKRKLKTGGPR